MKRRPPAKLIGGGRAVSVSGREVSSGGERPLSEGERFRPGGIAPPPPRRHPHQREARVMHARPAGLSGDSQTPGRPRCRRSSAPGGRAEDDLSTACGGGPLRYRLRGKNPCALLPREKTPNAPERGAAMPSWPLRWGSAKSAPPRTVTRVSGLVVTETQVLHRPPRAGHPAAGPDPVCSSSHASMLRSRVGIGSEPWSRTAAWKAGSENAAPSRRLDSSRSRSISSLPVR
jgi:hypothetical protein